MSAPWRRLIRLWTSGAKRAPLTPGKRRRSLSIERLEDRCVPSVSPVGPEVRVNSPSPTYTTNTQQQSAVGSNSLNPLGTYVVAWSSNQTGGTGFDIYAQMYNSAGVPVGSVFQVNTTLTGDQTTPAVAMDDSGNFIVVWASAGVHIEGRTYNASGTPASAEFQVDDPTNPFAVTGRDTPAVAVTSNLLNASGVDAQIVWHAVNATNDGMMTRTMKNGAMAGNDILPYTTTTGAQSHGHIAMNATGTMVVFVEQSLQAGTYDIFGRRYNAVAGTFYESVEFVVDNSANQQIDPNVAMDRSANNMVVFTWSSNQASNVSVMLNNSGTLSAPTGYGADLNPSAVAVGDVNGDGTPDIVVANNSSNDVSVLLGNGDGTFQPAVNYATGASPIGVVLGDFDGDTKLDIITASSTATTISVLRGNGDGTFGAASSVSVGNAQNGIAIGDFNSDGKLDVVVSQTVTGNDRLDFLRNTSTVGAISFAASTTVNVGNVPTGIAVADLNNDGKPDVVVANSSSGTVFFLQNTTGAGAGTFTFTTTTSASVGTTPVDVAIGDFTGDGKPDVAVLVSGSNTVRTFTNTSATSGGLTFTLSGTSLALPSGASATAIAVADMNNNGKKDIIVSDSGTNQVSVFSGSGTGTFAAAVNSAAGTSPQDVAVGNFDGTAFPDVVTASRTTSYDVYARRYFAASNAFQGAAFQVNTTSNGNQINPAVAMDDQGDFMIAWQSNQTAANGYDIYGRLYLPSGTAVTVGSSTNEFLINTTLSGDQIAPDAGMIADGDFVVSWNGNVPGDTSGIARQMYRRDPTPTGGEFKVNTFVTDKQRLSSIAMDDQGDFMIVWQSFGQDAANTYGIYGQRYNSAGVAQGSEFLVTNTTAGNQTYASIAYDNNGNYIVAWASDQSGTYDIYYRRFSVATGAALANEVRVNTTTANSQTLPAVAADGSGNFWITWASYGQDAANSWGIFAQRYNSAGVAQGAEFQVNVTTAGDQLLPSIAMDTAGDAVICWSSNYGSTIGTGDIKFRRYTAGGTALDATDQTANATSSGYQVAGTVSMSFDGDFVIAWTSNQNGNYDIYARRYSWLGGGTSQNDQTTPVTTPPASPAALDTTEFLVNTTTSGDQLESVVKLDKDGDFVVSWMGLNQTGDPGYGIYARRFQGNWVSNVVVPYSNEIRVNTSTTANQTVPTLGMDADGDFVVSWSSQSGADTSSYGVYAQRYTATSVASFKVAVANRQATASLNIPQAQAYAGPTKPVVVATLDTGVDYASPALYQNIWINQGEIPPAVRARLKDVDHDGRITFVDLNAPANRGIVKDTNHNGYIDGADLLAQWSDGQDNDHDGYVDDIIGWNFADNNNNPYDNNGHGTGTAGLVTAVDPNAQIMALKFIGSTGTGYTQEAVAALQYAIYMGATVATGSWAQVYSDQWLSALQQAQSAGMIFVAAAGNDDPSALLALQQFHLDNVLIVAASDGQKLASFSNADPNVVDLAAPGVGILTPTPGGGTEARSGTSVAAAFAAGAAALVWGNKPSLYYRSVLDALVSSAHRTPGLLAGTEFGGLDVFAALRLSDPNHTHARTGGTGIGTAQAAVKPPAHVVIPPISSVGGTVVLAFELPPPPAVTSSTVSLLPTASGASSTVLASYGSMEALYARSLVAQMLDGSLNSLADAAEHRILSWFFNGPLTALESPLIMANLD
jgi:hypothetical protein